MPEMIEKQIFWDEKILNWEKDKYDFKDRNLTDVNQSVKNRLSLAEDFSCCQCWNN